jgi:hypothetical protein
VHPSHLVLLRGEGLLRQGSLALATVRYQLWHTTPEGLPPASSTRAAWAGTIQVLAALRVWSPTAPVSVHLVEDAYRLLARLEGSGPRYSLVGLTSLEPEP